jgi:hypothetical protein
MWFILVVTLLTGCTSAVHLRHPVTGQTTQCGPYANIGGWKYTALSHERACVEDYQLQGFQRVP